MRKKIRNCCSRLLNSILVISLIFAQLSLSGCTDGSDAVPTHIRIGVSTYDEYDTFISSVTKYMAEWCKEKEKESGITITLDIVSAKGSQLTQNDQVEKFVSKEYDVVCVNLVDRTDPTVIIDRAKAADVPVIFFNRELVKEDLERWDKLYYVGAMAEQSGRLQAQIIINDLADSKKFAEIDSNHNGIIQYVMLEGEAGHQDTLIRTKTCIETIKDAGFVLEKVGDEIANWNQDQALTKMSALLSKYPSQIEMVIANNDDMALGALQAVEEKKPVTTPYIIGINGTDEALEAVRTRKLNGTVFNDAKSKSDTIMEMAYGLAVDKAVPDTITLIGDKYVYLPYEAVTYDNVQSFLKRIQK